MLATEGGAMETAMVTGRMSEGKKKRGGKVLQRSNLTASKAINLLYDRIIEDDSVDFLTGDEGASQRDWELAARFVDSLSEKRESRFDGMSDAQIRADRLRARGLL